MAGLMARIKSFSRSPEGRRLVSQAKRAASDPRTKQQAKQLLGRLRRPKH